MMKFLKQLMKNESGQALPIVLCVLILGSLTISPLLNYMATSLKHGMVVTTGIEGLYAADAGMEDTLWRLKNGIATATQLSQNINQTSVTMQTEDKGPYSLYLGTLVQPGEHNDYLSVSGNMTWDEGAQAYKYTITVSWQDGANIHLSEVGARLPLGYSYEAGSAANFPANLSTAEPNQLLDSYGAYLLDWQFESPLPSVSESNPQRTQTFHISGEGSPGGDYAWVVANRGDIGEVGEISGTLYKVTAIATKAETREITARIVADVVKSGATIYVVAWQVSR